MQTVTTPREAADEFVSVGSSSRRMRGGWEVDEDERRGSGGVREKERKGARETDKRSESRSKEPRDFEAEEVKVRQGLLLVRSVTFLSLSAG